MDVKDVKRVEIVSESLPVQHAVDLRTVMGNIDRAIGDYQEAQAAGEEAGRVIAEVMNEAFMEGVVSVLEELV